MPKKTIVEVQNEIIDYLRDSDIPNVWEETVPVGAELPKQNGVYLPYVIISFGGLSPVAQHQQGITSSRDNIKWSSVGLECIGQSPEDKRVVASIVRDLLEGYEPAPGWGQLVEQLSDSYSVKVPDFTLWPVRYAMGIVYNTNVNA